MGILGQQGQDGRTAAPKPMPEPIRATAPPPPPPVRKAEDKGIALRKAGVPDSVLASGLAIEGNIEGDGNVRIAGRFKGQVNAKGEIAIMPGAAVEGELRAEIMLVAGDVRGQIQAASRVELKASSSLIGDLQAGSLTVAAGSKMRGKVEFGWKAGESETVEQAEIGLGD